MFFNKQKRDEVVVRGVKQEFIDMVNEQNQRREGLNHAMKVILDQYAEIEKEKSEMWNQIYEEYSLSRKDSYRMDLVNKQIILKGN